MAYYTYSFTIQVDICVISNVFISFPLQFLLQSLHLCPDCVSISQQSPLLYTQVLPVQAQLERSSIRHVELPRLFFSKTHQDVCPSTNRTAVTHNQQFFPLQQFPSDLLVKKYSYSLLDIAQTLSLGQQSRIYVLVPLIVDWVTWVIFEDLRRSNHIASPPFSYHLLAIGLHNLQLIQSLSAKFYTCNAPQNFQFNYQRFSTGRQTQSIQSSMWLRVFMDLVSLEQYARSNQNPCDLRIRPQWMASSSPLVESLASCQPDHCLNLLCCVQPWRTITSGNVLNLQIFLPQSSIRHIINLSYQLPNTYKQMANWSLSLLLLSHLYYANIGIPLLLWSCGIKIIITMRRLDSRSKQLHNINPQDNLSSPQSFTTGSYQLKEENLNAELLRIRSQYMQKYVEQAWLMDQEELMDFFSNYQSLCQVIDTNELVGADSKLVRTENKIYIGQIRNKKKHGIGVTIYREGRVYEGSYADNEKSGLGCEIYGNGNLYIGEYHQNKKHGKGTFFWFSLCDNSATKEAHHKVEQYQGTWWGGLPDGEGQHEKANGDFYLGHFKNGLKHGEGVQYYFNGDKYKGEFVNGLPEGFGEYTWKDGSIYRGDFKQGYRNGYGVWEDNEQSNECYKGHYMLDKKHGYGVYDWANGYLYKGTFFEDQRCGEGQLYYHDALVYEGFWINGERCDEEEYLSTQREAKDSQSKASTKAASTHHERRGKTNKSKQKSPSKEKKEEQSFIVNFKHAQPQKTCKRGCCACKSKEKANKSKQRKAYVISRGK